MRTIYGSRRETTFFFFSFSLFLIYSDQILWRGNNAGPIILDSALHGLVVVLKNNAAGSRSLSS